MQVLATDMTMLHAEVNYLLPRAVWSMQLYGTDSAVLSELLVSAVRTSLTCEGADGLLGFAQTQQRLLASALSGGLRPSTLYAIFLDFICIVLSACLSP